MPYTISAQGTLAYTSGTGGTTQSVSPVNVGGILVLGVSIVDPGISVSSVSGGGATGWTRIAGPFVGAWNRNIELWFGRITTTGAATITLTPSSSVAGIRVDRGAQEFTSTGGASAVWSADGAGSGQTNTSASVAYPTLTPSGAARLYFGYAVLSDTPTGGATAGYTEQDDANGNAWLYNPNVSTAQSPATNQASSGTFDAVAALVVANAVATPGLVVDRGSTANTTAATTSSVTLTSPTTIAIGNYLLARVAVDNSGTNGAAPGCTVTDPRSNTWTVLGPALVDPGAAAAGATAYLAYTRVTTAYQAADALTFNWGGISTTAKAIVVEEWNNIASANPVAVSTVTANAAASTTVSVAITPTASNQLVYTCLATEGIAGDSITYDADATSGTWSTLTRTASANATATNNQCVAGQYKVVSASGAQTWDATITSRDWAALAVVFAPPASSPLPQPIRRLNIGALLDL